VTLSNDGLLDENAVLNAMETAHALARRKHAQGFDINLRGADYLANLLVPQSPAPQANPKLRF